MKKHHEISFVTKVSVLYEREFSHVSITGIGVSPEKLVLLFCMNLRLIEYVVKYSFLYVVLHNRACAYMIGTGWKEGVVLRCPFWDTKCTRFVWNIHL